MAPPLGAAPLDALLRGDAAALLASPALAAAAAALVLLTLLVAALLARALRGARRDAVLLLGTCGAGKTALFSQARPARGRARSAHAFPPHAPARPPAPSQLRDGGVFGGSVTSMAENAARVRCAGAPGQRARDALLVDLPGHPRLRSRLDAFAPAARALIFLVDGTDGVFVKNCRATAECARFRARARAARLGLRSRRVACHAALAAHALTRARGQAAAGRADAPGPEAAHAAAAGGQQDGQRAR
jgi:hypothetical protein